jgi:hypothetical protein
MSTMKLEELCDDVLRQMELRVIIGESVEVAAAASGAGAAKGDAAVVTRLFVAKDVGEGEDVEDMVEIGGPDDLLAGDTPNIITAFAYQMISDELLAGDELCVTHAEVEFDIGGFAVVPVTSIKRPSHDGSRRSCTKTMIRAKVRDVSTRDGYQGAPHVVNADLCAKYDKNSTRRCVRLHIFITISSGSL